MLQWSLFHAIVFLGMLKSTNATAHTYVYDDSPYSVYTYEVYNDDSPWQNGLSNFCVNESSLQYGFNGKVSIMNTFLLCLQTVSDSLFFPGYYTMAPLKIVTTTTLNNLMNIDELSNAATLDFLFFASWQDSRLAMPALFNELGELTHRQGIDITSALTTQNYNGEQLGIWTPDFIFPDASNIETTDLMVRLFPNGTIWHMRRMVMTLTESAFNYQKYPHDTLSILLRFYSFSYSNESLVIVHPPPGTYPSVSLSKGQNGGHAIATQPVWLFNNVTFTILQQEFNKFFAPRYWGVVDISVTRRPQGLIFRLAVPVLLLVVMGSLAFWADPGDRMNISITVLLAVSALYIVVFQNIPMIGILTSFDTYFLALFFILFVCCLFHQLIVRLLHQDEKSLWPLRKVYIQLLEFLGKILFFPLSAIFYISLFYYDVNSGTLAVFVIAVSTFILVIGIREYSGTYLIGNDALAAIKAKAANMEDLSSAEVFYLNILTYGKFTSSLSHHMRQIAHDRKQHSTSNITRSSDSVGASGAQSGAMVEMSANRNLDQSSHIDAPVAVIVNPMNLQPQQATQGGDLERPQAQDSPRFRRKLSESPESDDEM